MSCKWHTLNIFNITTFGFDNTSEKILQLGTRVMHDLFRYTGCQEIDVPLPFECKIIMSPFLVTLWCCTSMEARQRLCFSERSLVPVCMCCWASSTGSFVRVLIYQKLQCRYGEGVHLFDTVQGCGST